MKRPTWREMSPCFQPRSPAHTAFSPVSMWQMALRGLFSGKRGIHPSQGRASRFPRASVSASGPVGPDLENLPRGKTNPPPANALDLSVPYVTSSLASFLQHVPSNTDFQTLPGNPNPLQPVSLCPYSYILLKISPPPL